MWWLLWALFFCHGAPKKVNDEADLNLGDQMLLGGQTVLCDYLPALESALWQRKKERKKESEVVQSCPTLCDPVDCSLPGSFVHGIF